MCQFTLHLTISIPFCVKMKAAIISILVVSVFVNSNVSLKLDSILQGTQVSLGPYSSSITVGNLSAKYVDLDSSDMKASKNAIELIEILRRMFGVGVGPFPPLDPYSTNDVKPLNIGSESFISGKVILKSLNVTGTKNFDLKTLQVRVKTGRTDFEISLPEVNVNVDFETDLYVSEIIPLALNGQLWVQLDKLSLVGGLQTEVRLLKGGESNVVYQVSGVTAKVATENIKVALNSDIRIDNELLQSVYAGEDNSSLSLWITSTEDLIKKYVANSFIKLANKILSVLSVAQVNAFLLPEDKV